jgi:putative ABC transport system substrate-binding protein
MTVRVLLVAAALLCAAPPAGEAQHVRKAYRIGVLESVAAEANAEYLDAFRGGLKQLGFEEGRDFVLEYRSADGLPQRFTDLARELVRLEVDLIVTRGTPAAFAAKHATATIPIVMATSGEPVIEGLVASLARPGGNITGFHIMTPPELGGRRLQLLREAVPTASRIGILWNPVDLQPPLIMKDTEKAARAMGIQLKSLELPRAWPSAPSKAFDQAFEDAMMGQLDALIAVEDYLTFTSRSRIVDFAAMSRLPVIYGLREFVDAGGLMSYGTDRRDLFRRAAGYAHRILNGARPGDLPIEPPARFELAINLKTAETLGLTLPPSLVRRADHVVRDRTTSPPGSSR